MIVDHVLAAELYCAMEMVVADCYLEARFHLVECLVDFNFGCCDVFGSIVWAWGATFHASSVGIW